MLNPAKKDEALNSPIERANDLNDPKFQNSQGYYPYDLSHSEYCTTLFGLATPTCYIDTVPGDRIVMRDNIKLIRNQINGNLLSTINMYSDSFYVPLRNVIPTNFEKIIPNPVKGEDIVNSALPQVPIYAFLRDLYRSQKVVSINGYTTAVNSMINRTEEEGILEINNAKAINYMIDRLLLVSTIISRGELLDYLGFQLDTPEISVRGSKLQSVIDNFQKTLYELIVADLGKTIIYAVSVDPSKDEVNFIPTFDGYDIATNGKSSYRDAISSIFEAGKMPYFNFTIGELENADTEALTNSIRELVGVLDFILTEDETVDTNDVAYTINAINEMPEPFINGKCINIGKILAYQQVIAHYYTNDKIDNVYSSDLFMQNLRSVMYPSEEGSMTTTEPVFDMNGVKYEYDYISYGGFTYSLLNDKFAGKDNRQWIFSTLMFLRRRTLRFGDYFSSSRTSMLAITDQLSINVEDGAVSPIDVTKNLLMQRFLNASNYIGQGFLQYMASMFGVKPSDTGCTPRFISHRKIVINNQLTNNTANDQGKQTTNLVGYSDQQAFDVFIDDFGYLITIQSYDTLPIYTSGIDNTYHFSDRFDFYNPMLQNIGDQSIKGTELIGFNPLHSTNFGYVPRNAEYKYKLSKAHGAFCNNDLAGFMIKYPLETYMLRDQEGEIIYDIHVNPDFIRDKPVILDPVIGQLTGVSPAEYWHFVVSCFNEIHAARKIQALPSILF